MQTVSAIKCCTDTKKDVRNHKQNSYFLQLHYMRLGVGSHLQAECVAPWGLGRLAGAGPLWAVPAVSATSAQCLASKCPSVIVPGTAHAAWGFFSLPLFKIQIVKFTPVYLNISPSPHPPFTGSSGDMLPTGAHPSASHSARLAGPGCPPHSPHPELPHCTGSVGVKNDLNWV